MRWVEKNARVDNLEAMFARYNRLEVGSGKLICTCTRC